MQRLEDLWKTTQREYKKYAAIAHKKWSSYENRQPYRAKIIKRAAKLCAYFLASIFFFIILVWLGIFGRLPSEKELRRIQNDIATEVYDNEGALLGKYYVENRTNASLEEISPLIIQALVATEDARFFNHSGIDFRSTMRVLFKSILLQDDDAGGGSTISQQLAKNVFPRKRLWFLTIPVSKVKEIITARRLERLYTKEELLELYLNTVPFSENIYGINVVSQRFFGKKPSEVSVEEAAVMVGMLKGPSLYNPKTKPENAIRRRNVVMEQMVKYGYLEAGATLDSLKALPLELRYKQESSNDGLATYFRAELREFLKEWAKDKKTPDGTPYNIFTDGLKVYTTLNSKMQQYAEEAVAEHFKKLQKDFDNQWRGQKPWKDDAPLLEEMRRSDRYKRLSEAGMAEDDILKAFDKPVKMKIFTWQGDEERTMSPMDSLRYYHALLNVGFLVINPKNGKVLSWVGGINHRTIKYDHVKSVRQVGSIMKPFVYAAAIRQGIEPCEFSPNQLKNYPEYKNWTPENADGSYGGSYSMTGAVANSINTIAVDVALRTGIGNVAYVARSMGIESPIPIEPSIALGSNEASVLEMTRAFATLVNRGKRPPMPWFVERIENAEGEVIEDFSTKQKEMPFVIQSEIADMVLQMLQSVVDRGTGNRIRYQYGLYGALAGKTGTTQHQTDGWFMGITPNLVGGVWVGADDPQVRFRSTALGQGASSALPVFGLFLKKVYADKKFAPLSKNTFPPLADEVRWRLECPDRLGEGESFTLSEYTPNAYTDSLENNAAATEIWNDANNIFQDSMSSDEKARRREEERRQKQKELLDNILKQNKAKEESQDE